MVSKGKLGSVTKRFIILFNIIAFTAIIFALDKTMTFEVEAEAEVSQPREASLPHITITDEMKVGMFYDGLRIDHSVINPKDIVKSINPWESYVQRYSGQYSVDPDLVHAIIYAESKGDPYSISKDGAVGLMQIMPSTAAYFGISDVFDPEENIKAGVMYIDWLVKHYDEEYMLWAWNAGPSRIRKYHMPGETKKFIVEVLSVKTFLKDDKNKTI